jgi:hypothetical protein
LWGETREKSMKDGSVISIGPINESLDDLFHAFFTFFAAHCMNIEDALSLE